MSIDAIMLTSLVESPPALDDRNSRDVFAAQALADGELVVPRREIGLVRGAGGKVGVGRLPVAAAGAGAVRPLPELLLRLFQRSFPVVMLEVPAQISALGEG